MIIIEDGSQVSDLITKLDLNFGAVKLDTQSLEFTQIHSNEFYLISTDDLIKIDKASLFKIGSSKAVILIGDCDPSKVLLDNVIYHHQKNSKNKILKSQLLLLQELISQAEVMRSQLISLNLELSHLTGGLEHELIRLKKAHERKTPKRLDEVKGLGFFSKYSAGESMGGEFFDMFKSQNHVFILMSSTSSYLASSSVLTFFNALKIESEISEKSQIQFINELKKEISIINKNKSKPVDVHILTAIIDLNSYVISGYNLGKFEFKSSMGKELELNKKDLRLESDIQEGKFECSLSRREKLLLTSPGFLKNWEKLNSDFIPEDLLSKPGIKSLDILDELFFQMKKDSESGFLQEDASVILLEVDKNVMVQM